MPKVVENDVTEEFTVEHGKRSLVASAFERIRLLFQVLVAFSSPEASASKTGFQWLALKGEKEKTTKAKEYIKSLCNPEMEITVPFVESFYAVIYGSRDELERTTRAVVNFPSKKECSVQGNAEAVIMVKSAIEDKLHHMNSLPSQQDIDPSLREFALKLGYSKQVIDQAVRKLGSDATQNTLLSELLTTKASQPHQTCATSTQPVVPAPTSLYLRRENRDVVARGASNGHPFTRGTGFENSGELYMERGASQLNVSLRKDNRDISGHGHAMRAGLERPADILVRGPPMMKPSMVAVGYDGSSDVLERGVMRGTKRGYERSGDMVRSLIPGASHGVHDMHQFPGSSVVNERILPDRQEEHFVYQQIKSVQETVTDRSSDLRPVVIDGSNVAMSHGRQEYFSCKGIQLCVDWFKKKGHKEITVFVPLWRKEASRPDRKITDQDILYNLERERVLVFTPSRKINGRRIVCYDDRFIIKLAVETDGIVVSNDNFRDLTKEGPRWKDTIEQRLLMYSFVGDMFMVPDDPLGKHGPTLDEFLRKGSPTHPKICPYLKKCTYGLKCRFYHPERDQDRKLQELRSIFSESVPDAVMIRVLNDNPAADVSLLANQLCDLGYGLGKH